MLILKLKRPKEAKTNKRTALVTKNLLFIFFLLFTGCIHVVDGDKQKSDSDNDLNNSGNFDNAIIEEKIIVKQEPINEDNVITKKDKDQGKQKDLTVITLPKKKIVILEKNENDNVGICKNIEENDTQKEKKSSKIIELPRKRMIILEESENNTEKKPEPEKVSYILPEKIKIDRDGRKQIVTEYFTYVVNLQKDKKGSLKGSLTENNAKKVVIVPEIVLIDEAIEYQHDIDLLKVEIEEEIGCLCYACFHLKPNTAELDIWLKARKYCGKGFGPQALQQLVEYLTEMKNIKNFIIRPSEKNIRAIAAYEKVGFIRTADKENTIKEYLKNKYVNEYGEGDYGFENTAVLIIE